MAIKIQSTKNITTDGANLLIYGESGVGKTGLISDLKNQIILSSDKGLLRLKDHDIPYYDINSMKDIDDAYDIVKKSNYDNVILDSLSEMAEVVFADIKHVKSDGSVRKDPRSAYGDLADMFGVMIRKFRDLKGKNTIFICKMKHYYDEDGVVVKYGPLIPGKVLPHGIPYLTDEVFAYIEGRKGQDKYFLTKGDRKYPAKDRSGALAEKEYNPNLNDIINRILEKTNG